LDYTDWISGLVPSYITLKCETALQKIRDISFSGGKLIRMCSFQYVGMISSKSLGFFLTYTLISESGTKILGVNIMSLLFLAYQNIAHVNNKDGVRVR
jgi:hypothetical protein